MSRIRRRRREADSSTAPPFEGDSAEYHVLVSGEGRRSVRPVFAEIPQGWETVHGVASCQECPDHVTEHGTDTRPQPRRDPGRPGLPRKTSQTV
nr:MbtH family protein [Streptomyces atrovirens]